MPPRIREPERNPARLSPTGASLKALVQPESARPSPSIAPSRLRQTSPRLLAEGQPPPLSAGARLKAVAGRSTFQEYIWGINTAIAATLDFAPDVFASLFERLGINAEKGQVRDFFVRQGWAPPTGQEPETRAFSAGHMHGVGIMLALPIPKAAGLRPAALPAGGPRAGLAAGLKQAGETAIRQPVRFAALESVSAAAAGVGIFEARKRFPDSPAAEAMGAILFGLTPAGAIAAPGLAARTALGVAGRLPITGAAIRFFSSIL
ncbi:hypothetical protein LCGC14_1467750, partial [marine sediment metagenome]